MSRYMINKLIRHVELSDANVRAYVADPPGYVDGWLAGSGGPDDRTDDRLLTAAERAAFSTRDFGTLYELGAHPYLLWHWVEAVFIHEEEWRPLVERYRSVVTPLRYPNFIV